MKFQILSHAGLQIQSKGKTLICDPWVLGSCYWRSWWNYPPVSKELLDSLKPDFIYITHIHWDHFQSPSLKKFSPETKIIIPKGNFDRMKRDLNSLGFFNVVELKHGESIMLADDFKLTSYTFDLLLDSAVVIETDGQRLLNLNDAKFMGAPLRQILRKHPKPDFVFRSHSSANSRLSYHVRDDKSVIVDDLDAYIESFADVVRATGAKYAIPFASNHCHLHKDVIEYNNIVQTPHMVEDYFRKHGIESPQVKVMVSGDYFDSETGFHITPHDYFTNRENRIAEYAEKNKKKLEDFYALEAKARMSLKVMDAYFQKFFKVIPWFLRGSFKGKEFTYILASGEKEYIFGVDIYNRKVRELTSYNDKDNPIQIFTTAYIMRNCLAIDLFSHLTISKRVRFIMNKEDMKHVKRLHMLFNFYENDMLPLKRMFQARMWETWFLRWREIILYFQIALDLFRYKEFRFKKYLKPVS